MPISAQTSAPQNGFEAFAKCSGLVQSNVTVAVSYTHLHDKRDSIAARDAKREIDRAMKERNR